MGQIVGSIKGIKEACEQLNTPVVSGNVSLYNETNGKSILPTPVIGMVGIVDNIEKIMYQLDYIQDILNVYNLSLIHI